MAKSHSPNVANRNYPKTTGRLASGNSMAEKLRTAAMSERQKAASAAAAAAANSRQVYIPKFWNEYAGRFWNGFSVPHGGCRQLAFSLDSETGEARLLPVEGGLLMGSFPGLLATYQSMKLLDVIIKCSWTSERSDSGELKHTPIHSIQFRDQEYTPEDSQWGKMFSLMEKAFPGLKAWLVPVDCEQPSYLCEPIQWSNFQDVWTQGEHSLRDMFTTAGITESTIPGPIYDFLKNAAVKTPRSEPDQTDPAVKLHCIRLVPAPLPESLWLLEMPEVDPSVFNSPYPQEEVTLVFALGRALREPAVLLNDPFDKSQPYSGKMVGHPSIKSKILIMVLLPNGQIRAASYFVPPVQSSGKKPYRK